MKKILFALSIAVAMAVSAEMKFGTVDLMLLVRNHPNYDSNKALLALTDKDYQKKLSEIKAEGDKLQEEGKKFAEQMRNPMLTAKMKDEAEGRLVEIQKQLMAIEQRFRSEAMRFRQELQDLETRLLKTTTDDLRMRIAKHAETNGYDFVFERNATTYSKATFDVTDDLLKAMGVEPKDAKGRDEGK